MEKKAKLVPMETSFYVSRLSEVWGHQFSWSSMTLNGTTNVDIVHLLNIKGLIFTFVPYHKYFIAAVQQGKIFSGHI